MEAEIEAAVVLLCELDAEASIDDGVNQTREVLGLEMERVGILEGNDTFEGNGLKEVKCVEDI